jgi:hypothetical protein
VAPRAARRPPWRDASSRWRTQATAAAPSGFRRPAAESSGSSRRECALPGTDAVRRLERPFDPSRLEPFGSGQRGAPGCFFRSRAGLALLGAASREAVPGMRGIIETWCVVKQRGSVSTSCPLRAALLQRVRVPSR